MKFKCSLWQQTHKVGQACGAEVYPHQLGGGKVNVAKSQGVFDPGLPIQEKVPIVLLHDRGWATISHKQSQQWDLDRGAMLAVMCQMGLEQTS